MKHLFVPYELAKLAKEKGFDEDCLAFYIKTSNIVKLELVDYPRNNTYLEKHPIFITAPLYQQLVDWFREKHKLHIVIETLALGYVACHNNVPEPETWGINKRWMSDPYDTYYEALTKALEEAFKFIKTKEEDFLLLKWGGFKACNFSNSPEAAKALEQYNDATDEEQQKLVLKMIDTVNGKITLWWTDEIVTKQQARDYVLSYGKKNVD